MVTPGRYRAEAAREVRNGNAHFTSQCELVMAQGNQLNDPAPDVSDQIAITAAHLAEHLRGRLRDVRLTVHGEAVVIRGRASSYYVKQLAQHAVMKRVSLPIAANEIEVQQKGQRCSSAREARTP